MKTVQNKASATRKRKRRAKSLSRRRLKDFTRFFPIAGPLVLTAFIYAWQHTRLTIVSLPIESLRVKRMELIKQNDSIRLRIEKLQTPQRIEAIAHEKLGMSSPETWQVVALDQPVQPPQSIGVMNRAEGKPPSNKKPARLLGFMKRRGNNGGDSPKQMQPETIPQSG